MARAVANETGAFFFLINGPEIMSKLAGESESNQEKHSRRPRRTPHLLYLLTSWTLLHPRERRRTGRLRGELYLSFLPLWMVSSRGILFSFCIIFVLLLFSVNLLIYLFFRAHVIVMAATNRPNSIDAALLKETIFRVRLG